MDQTRRQFFKGVVAVCVGVVVVPVVVAKRKLHQPPEWKSYTGAWEQYPEYVCRRVCDILPRNSICVAGHGQPKFEIAFFQCMNEDRIVSWSFSISRKEFDRNNPVQRCRLVTAKVAAMLRKRRDETGLECW